jgi:PadR family transcriptional regulator, regulatory protein PadR
LHNTKKDIDLCAVNYENSKSQMRKGILEYCVLVAISHKEVYASDILGLLKDARILVVEGTLYPILTRLKNAGLLSYRWEESVGGTPRKYYSLSDSGKDMLTELHNSWDELVTSIQHIRNQSPKP